MAVDIRYVAAPDSGADLRGVTELRVHGVGGTTPEDMLGDPHPVQVAGDRLAGFFRRGDVGGRHVEAYSWGGLTSRSALRVLWLLLLPFTLANLAGWMLRGEVARPPWRGVFRALVRLIALALTLTYVMWTSGIAVDLIGYQCGGQAGCASRHWWLSFLLSDTFWAYPARRLVAGSGVSLALIGLLGWLARATRQRYEGYDPMGGSSAPSPAEAEAAYERGLAAPAFWRGERLVRLLGRAHVAGALGLLTCSLAWTAAAVSGGGAPLLGGLAVVGVAVAAAAAVVVCMPARVPEPVVTLLARVAPGVLAVAAVLAWIQPAVPPAGLPGRLPGMALVSAGVLSVHVLMLLVLGGFLLAVVVGARGRPSATGRVFRWGGPLVAVSLGTLALDSFFAGTAVRLADWLGVPVPGGTALPPGGGPYLVYPQLYDVFSAAFTLVLATVGAAVGLWWWLVWRPEIREQTARLGEEYAGEEPPSVRGERAWLAAIARVRCLSRAVDAADVILTAMVLVALGLAAAGLLARLPSWRRGPLVMLPRGSWSELWTVCTWVVSSIPLVAVGIMRAAHRSPELRRKVAILWDVGTFWPRAHHPLAPPSYAERAVPDLERRLRRITDAGGRVVVSAHSQGTVLAAAALLQCDHQVRRDVALVTYGCPLARLYGRFFPAYFSEAVLTGLRAALAAGHPAGGVPRWRNFHRRTDLIGGPVFAADDPDDVLLPDPSTSRITPGEPWPQVRGHSGYLEDATMLRFVDDLSAALAAGNRLPPPPVIPANSPLPHGSR